MNAIRYRIVLGSGEVREMTATEASELSGVPRPVIVKRLRRDVLDWLSLSQPVRGYIRSGTELDEARAIRAKRAERERLRRLEQHQRREGLRAVVRAERARAGRPAVVTKFTTYPCGTTVDAHAMDMASEVGMSDAQYAGLLARLIERFPADGPE